MTETEDDKKVDHKLSQIADPNSDVSDKPDKYTQREKIAYDARNDPIITSILLVVAFLGITIWFISLGASTPAYHVTTQDSKIRNAIDSNGQLQAFVDLTTSLGIELAASAAMILIFYLVLHKQDEKRKILLLIVIATVALICIALPLFFAFNGNFAGNTLHSVGIEIMGSVVILALLENVVERLRKTNHSE